jgi:hypothetical protein
MLGEGQKPCLGQSSFYSLIRRFNMDFEGYCVKCRKKQQVKDGKVARTEKGRPMAKGVCPECGTKVTRFLSEKDVK